MEGRLLTFGCLRLMQRMKATVVWVFVVRVVASHPRRIGGGSLLVRSALRDSSQRLHCCSYAFQIISKRIQNQTSIDNILPVIVGFGWSGSFASLWFYRIEVPFDFLGSPTNTIDQSDEISSSLNLHLLVVSILVLAIVLRVLASHNLQPALSSLNQFDQGLCLLGSLDESVFG